MNKFILLLTFGLFYTSFQAQTNNTRLKQFEIKIRTTNDKIILKNISGNNWNKLKFPKYNETQLINQNGMTNSKATKNSESKLSKNLPNYLFSITFENKKVILKGFHGTSWKELIYDCKNKNCDTRINELGIK